MKIIHCADIHIGSKMTANLSSDKAKQRKRELLDNFAKLAEYAKANGVEVIIIAGDLFDGGSIPKSVINEVKEIIIKSSGIEFLYVAGNHDDKLIEEFNVAMPANLKLFNKFNEWTSYKIGDITFAGIDLAFTSGKAFYEKLALKENDFNVVIMHGDITKYEQDEGAEKIFLSLLKNKNIDYLALGHIHIPTKTPEKIDSRGVYAYSGCLDGRGFDEIGERGFIELEIDKNRVISNKFVSFALREFCEITVDITGLSSYLQIEEAANRALKNIDGKNLIKLILRGKYRADVVKEKDRLAESLNRKFYFCKIDDDSKLDIDGIDYKNDVSLLGEFVRHVLSRELKDEEKESIIALGIKVLNGEEIDL